MLLCNTNNSIFDTYDGPENNNKNVLLRIHPNYNIPGISP